MRSLHGEEREVSTGGQDGGKRFKQGAGIEGTVLGLRVGVERAGERRGTGSDREW